MNYTMNVEMDPSFQESLEVFSNPTVKDSLILDKHVMLDNFTTEHLLNPVYRPRFYNNYVPKNKSTSIYLQYFTPSMNVGGNIQERAQEEKINHQITPYPYRSVTALDNLVKDKNGKTIAGLGGGYPSKVFRMNERDESIPYSRKTKDELIRNHRSLYPYKVSNVGVGYNIPEVDKRADMWTTKDGKAHVTYLRKPVAREPQRYGNDNKETYQVGYANYRPNKPRRTNTIPSSESKELFDPSIEPQQYNPRNYRYNASQNYINNGGKVASSVQSDRAVDGGLIEYGGQKYQDQDSGSTFMKRQVGMDDHVAYYTNAFTPVSSNIYSTEELPDIKDFYDMRRRPDGSLESRFLSMDMNNLAEPYKSEFENKHDGIGKVRYSYDPYEMFKIPAMISGPSEVNRLKFTDPNGREIYDYIPEVPYKDIRKAMVNQYMADKEFIHDMNIAMSVRNRNMDSWPGEVFDEF